MRDNADKIKGEIQRLTSIIDYFVAAERRASAGIAAESERLFGEIRRFVEEAKTQLRSHP